MKIKRVLALLVMVSLILVGCSSNSGNSGDSGNAGGSGDAGPAIAYPEKSIDLTILFGAGGGADVVGRKLADIAARDLGQSIVANNRVGGGGAVGYQYVLNAKPDGYNVVWNSSSISTCYYTGNLPADQGFDAFRGVALATEEYSALAVKADAQWKNLSEFVEYAKAHPGEVTVANSGVGSFNHLTAAAIESALGVKFKHMPMDAKESTTALLGGKVDAIVNMAFDVYRQVEAGEMRALAVVGDARMELMPDVPTFIEEGYPEVDLVMYRGIAVHKDTPDEVVAILEKAFTDAANSQEFKDFAKQNGVAVKVLGAAEFDQYMADQDKQIADLMESIGMKKQ